MPRPFVFTSLTTLYHPVEGERVFPVGETDPGPAWTDRIGGEAVGSATTTSALKDLIAAQDQIEALEARLHANGHDLAVSAKSVADAKAHAKEMEQRAMVAEKALADAQKQSADYMRERDQARAEPSRAAAATPPVADAEADAAPKNKGGRPRKAHEAEA